MQWIRTGTVAVANGSAAVVGTLTAFLSNVRQGDIFSIDGTKIYEVLSVTDNTHLTLTSNFTGTTGTGVSYFVAQFAYEHSLAVEVSQLLAAAAAQTVDIFSGSGVPSNALGGDGSRYFRSDLPYYYVKAGGAWGSAIVLTGPTGATGSMGATGPTGPANSLSVGSVTTGAVGSSASAAITGTAPAQQVSFTIPVGATGATGSTGPQGSTGPTGANYTTTSATSNTVGTGDKTFTVAASLPYVPGLRVRAVSAADATKFMDGVVKTYSTTSLVITVTDIGTGTGAATDWDIGITGIPGATGPTGATGLTGPAGPVYAATSTTSLTVGSGSRAFTVAAGLPYLGGERVRAVSASDSTKFMSGVVTSYATTVLTVTVDLFLGSGTAADWNISITGEKGDQGAAGGITGLAATKGNGIFADGTTFAALAVGLNGQQIVADSTQTLGIRWDAVDVGICQGRLTLSTGVPVMTSTVSAATTIRFTPYLGATIALYNGTSWRTARFSEVSLALTGLTAASNYDIFGFDNSGTLALEALIWTNATTRATALVLQDGVYVKSGATTRRYLGTIRIDATTGQCSWVYGTAASGGGAASFGLWNMYNRLPIAALVVDSTSSWPYNTATWRAANGSNTNRVTYISGLALEPAEAHYMASAVSTSGGSQPTIGIGANVTNNFSGTTGWNPTTGQQSINAKTTLTALGSNFLQAVEFNGTGTGVATFYGNLGTAYIACGLHFKFAA